MRRIRDARLTGAAGIAAAALWLISWLGEVFVEGDVGGLSWYADQILATLALTGTAILMFGLAWTRSAGGGLAVRIVLTLAWAGWLLLAAGGICLLVAGSEDPGPVGLVFPIGGNLASLGGLVAGVVIAVRGEITGWRRYMPLLYGVVLAGAEFVQTSGDGNTPLTYGVELVEYLSLLILAFSLRTARFRVAATPSTAVSV